jgi:hypothetical protein
MKKRSLVKVRAMQSNFYGCRVSRVNEHWIRNTVIGVSISNSWEIHDTHFLRAGAASAK